MCMCCTTSKLINVLTLQSVSPQGLYLFHTQRMSGAFNCCVKPLSFAHATNYHSTLSILSIVFCIGIAGGPEGGTG